MNLTLHRTWPTSDCTIGQLFVDGVPECFTCEDVVREVEGEPVSSWKVLGQTAIPAGIYRVVIDFSNRFQRPMPHVLEVPGFDGVRIHSGNTAADTEGCILVGTGRAETSIAHSRDAFDVLLPKLQAALAAGDEITLEVA